MLGSTGIAATVSRAAAASAVAELLLRCLAWIALGGEQTGSAGNAFIRGVMGHLLLFGRQQTTVAYSFDVAIQ